MDGITLYTNPMSRGRIARWMLEEVGQPYAVQVVEYGPPMKAPEFLALNPMGKVPVLVAGDTVLTECAAICTWLAEAYPRAGLAPAAGSAEKADFLRWMFFGAGPLEAAATATSMGFDTQDAAGYARAGWGNLAAVADTLGGLLVDGRPYLLGAGFSAVDVYLGSQIAWGRQFDILPDRPGFDGYVARIMGREAAQRAQALDDALIPAQG